MDAIQREFQSTRRRSIRSQSGLVAPHCGTKYRLWQLWLRATYARVYAAPCTPYTVTAISISQSTWPCIRMPSHRRRSYSRDRSRTPPSDRDRSRSRTPPSDRDRSRSRSPERKIALPGGADPISESDYFLKNDEFREWLKEEKNKVRHRSHAL